MTFFRERITAGTALSSPRRLTREQWAKIGITVQFLALVRTLSEYFRLKHVLGPQFSLTVAVAALLCWLSVALFFFRRYGSAALVSAATVAVLFAFKVYWSGW